MHSFKNCRSPKCSSCSSTARSSPWVCLAMRSLCSTSSVMGRLYEISIPHLCSVSLSQIWCTFVWSPCRLFRWWPKAGSSEKLSAGMFVHHFHSFLAPYFVLILVLQTLYWENSSSRFSSLSIYHLWVFSRFLTPNLRVVVMSQKPLGWWK